MKNALTGRALAGEAIGTGFLLATVVGSGIMAEQLSGGNVGLALLANAIATGAILYVLITALGPVSGAHFNPAVTLAFALARKIAPVAALAYVAVQIVAGLVGVWTAHAMFDMAVWQVSQTARASSGQWLAEGVATFGLVFTILVVVRVRAEAVAAAVGLYITAAYWFTASTSFANPAVAIARSFTDTFSGIAPAHMPAFIGCQLVGAVTAWAVAGWLVEKNRG